MAAVVAVQAFPFQHLVWAVVIVVAVSLAGGLLVMWLGGRG